MIRRFFHCVKLTLWKVQIHSFAPAGRLFFPNRDRPTALQPRLEESQPVNQDVGNIVMRAGREVPDFLQEIGQPGGPPWNPYLARFHNAGYGMGPRYLVVHGLDRPKRDGRIPPDLLNQADSRSLVFNQDAVGVPFVILGLASPNQVGEDQAADV